MMRTIFKKGLFFIVFGILVFILGGIGGVFFDRYFVPELAAYPRFADFDLLKKATERVTIINKTEQVVVREDDTVERIISQPSTAVVNILAIEEGRATKEVTAMTGVFLTNDGLAVTYSETPFLSEATRYSALLFDGSSHAAQYVGHDPLTNLAFFRLENSVSTPAIAFANSDDARVGKKLIAIGNAAEEYQNRFSYGILNNFHKTFNLSGKTVSSSEKWEGVFEMDLPKAEEFVGGPAIQYNGEMLGIIGTLRIDNENHTFLIPSNAVRAAMDMVISGGERPVLGLYYLPITKAYALGHDLKRDRGALVYSSSGSSGLAVLSGSIAQQAGIRLNDIIIAVNGREINLSYPLSVALGAFSIGDTVELLIVRNGVEMKVPVQL